MKRSASYKLLPALVAALGGIGLALRLALYTLKGENGLLPADHPLHIATLVLAVFTAGLVLFFVRRLDGGTEYTDNFPVSRVAALGACLAGICLLPVSLDILESADSRLGFVWAALGFLSVVSLLFIGWCRWKGWRPFFLFHGVVCVFFALHMVCQYRLWSGNPQLEDYLFAICACVLLTLAAYYRTAFDAGLGRRRMLLFTGLMAAFCCLLSIAGDGDGGLYIAGALWSATNLCVTDPPVQFQKPKEE